MASFKELKNRILENTPDPKLPTSLESNPNVSLESDFNTTKKSPIKTFELEEARYMLNLIANSEFKGRDVQVVYNIAIKLQDIVQEINK